MRRRTVTLVALISLLAKPVIAADMTATQCPEVGSIKSKIHLVPAIRGYEAMLKQNETDGDNRKYFSNPEAAEVAGFRTTNT